MIALTDVFKSDKKYIIRNNIHIDCFNPEHIFKAGIKTGFAVLLVKLEP